MRNDIGFKVVLKELSKNKRFLVTFLIILLIVFIFILGWYFIEGKGTDHYDVSKLVPSYFNETDNDWIYLTALKDSYSYQSKYIEMVLTNDSNYPIKYGYGYQLETFIDGKWYTVPLKENHLFLLVAIELEANSNIKLDILLDDFQCLPGKHRIIKNISVISSDKSTELRDNNKPANKNKRDISIVAEFNLT